MRSPDSHFPFPKLLGDQQHDRCAHDGRNDDPFVSSSSKRLEQSSHFELHVGGSESNVAVGLARLGLSVAWLSRLTDNVLGRMIEQSLRSTGVDTSHIAWTPDDRIGLYFHEEGNPPRPGRVLYDRKDSAFCDFQRKDIPPT